jgi:hypothetical protein
VSQELSVCVEGGCLRAAEVCKLARLITDTARLASYPAPLENFHLRASVPFSELCPLGGAMREQEMQTIAS